MKTYDLGLVDLSTLYDAAGRRVGSLPISGKGRIVFIDHEPGVEWPHKCEYRLAFTRPDGLFEAQRAWWTQPPAHERLQCPPR